MKKIQETFLADLDKERNEREETRGRYIEGIAFEVALILWEAFILIIYAIWFDYPSDPAVLAEDVVLYPYFRDVFIMIFFGFGLLMSFMRRGGFMAIGYSLLIAAIVSQWSILLEVFFHELHEHPRAFDTRRPVGVTHMIDGLFCSGAVLISYGAVHGKISPMQILVMCLIEPFFYWLNFFIGALKLEAHDVGGGIWIHTFGCYFGLAVCFFLTNKKTRAHPDNCSNYSSDTFAMLGSLFLMIMWPSFNAGIAPTDLGKVRAFWNTFISLCASSISTIIFSRLVTHQKLDMVHVQNSVLAGGVVMGVVADLELHPSTPIACGFAVGAISVFGYRYLTPFMTRHLHIQDVCGIHNLHGMPGVIGCILGIWSTFGLTQNDHCTDDDCPRSDKQPGMQTAALFVTLGIAIGSGIFCGMIMWLVGKMNPTKRRDYYNDRKDWHVPTDFEKVEREENWEESEGLYDEHHIRGHAYHKVHAAKQDVNTDLEMNERKRNEKKGGDSDSD